MKSYRINNSARQNFGFFLTPFNDSDPKSFPEEHQLLEAASKVAADRLKECKIRPRTFLTLLSLMESDVIGSVKNCVAEFVASASNEVREASPLFSQFMNEDGESAMYSYATAVSFVCMKKYSETIEYKKRMASGQDSTEKKARK
jgi:hypothetical protein